MKENHTFNLVDVEIETVERAAKDLSKGFDKSKTAYTTGELGEYGLVREGYNKEEMQELGIIPQVVTSHDKLEEEAQEILKIDAPFGSGIKKWQLPIDMMPIRVAKTIFPKGSVVDSHVHPKNTDEEPGGGLRMIATGSVTYNGKQFKAGDWFFVPNGTPYNFVTDENEETIVFYTYTFFGAIEGNRFSHPH